MPDLSHQLRSRLETTQSIDLELGSDALHPAYQGLSILNLPASLCHWLGASGPPHPALAIPELDALVTGVEQVIVVLIDAVSYDRFRGWIAGMSAELNPENDHCLLAPLTSVVPSTTSSALTTIWTGRSPAEHGILGYEIFLKEFGLVANMITHTPMAFEGPGGSLYAAGFQPETALPVPTLGKYLASAGVEAHAFLHYSIGRSGLSRMHYAGVEKHLFGGLADLWIGVRHLALKSLEGPRLIWVYHGGVDGVSHRYGPNSERARAEFVTFIQALQQNFISDLSLEARHKTLLLILSDHGQIPTVRDPKYELSNHPDLMGSLHLLPTGENRLIYLYPRPGMVKKIIEYFKNAWPQSFNLIPSEKALKVGLFGPGPPAKETRDRLGDFIAVSQGDAYLWWAPKENHLLGRHGGLSPQEMLVPLMAVRLG
ncbi:MAG: alkaline phosphatase family protein [Anaerolineaceae bacterium]|nr:MAG: alkaline phosphatase family protein [Anaerolineaceae bacterium]